MGISVDAGVGRRSYAVTTATWQVDGGGAEPAAVPGAQEAIMAVQQAGERSAVSVESTRRVMDAYLQALVDQGRYAAYLADDVTLTLMGAGQDAAGREAVRQMIDYLHQHAFAARPRLKTLIVAAGQATLEADFIGTHTGEFAGIAATGKEVNVPYAVVYDVALDTVTALRIYMPMDALLRQLQGAG